MGTDTQTFEEADTDTDVSALISETSEMLSSSSSKAMEAHGIRLLVSLSNTAVLTQGVRLTSAAAKAHANGRGGLRRGLPRE